MILQNPPRANKRLKGREGVLVVMCAIAPTDQQPGWTADQLAQYRQATQLLIAEQVRNKDIIIQHARGLFAIYLDGATPEQAAMVADRIVAASILAEVKFARDQSVDMEIAIRGVKPITKLSFDQLCAKALAQHGNQQLGRVQPITPGLPGSMMRGTLHA